MFLGEVGGLGELDFRRRALFFAHRYVDHFRLLDWREVDTACHGYTVETGGANCDFNSKFRLRSDVGRVSGCTELVHGWLRSTSALFFSLRQWLMRSAPSVAGSSAPLDYRRMASFFSADKVRRDHDLHLHLGEAYS